MFTANLISLGRTIFVTAITIIAIMPSSSPFMPDQRGLNKITHVFSLFYLLSVLSVADTVDDVAPKQTKKATVTEEPSTSCEQELPSARGDSDETKQKQTCCHTDSDNSDNDVDLGLGAGTETKPATASPCAVPDLGDCLETCVTATDIDKLHLLTKHWRPTKDFIFPQTEFGKKKRRFSAEWAENYPWLVYSPSKDGAFCKFCMIFADSDTRKRGSSLVTTPFRNWKKAVERFAEHNNVEYHQLAAEKAENFISTMSDPSKAIDSKLNKDREQQIKTNRQILSSIVSTVLFCGRQGLALRGKRDDGVLQEENRSNFNALLTFRIESGDELLATHLKTCDKTATYVSKTTQNNIIAIIGEQIRETLLKKVTRAGYYSVLADEVVDSANWEQLSIVLRYVDPDEQEIREDFIAFIECEGITGSIIADNIVQSLTSWGLEIGKIRGQGYDGASNMSGKFKGVQARIQELNKQAPYFHCASHCLNLCVVHACRILEVKNMFGVPKEVSLFFSLSPKRQRKFEHVVESAQAESKRRKLVDLCKTRWVERHSAFETFAELFPVVYDCLGQMVQENTDWDSETLTKAGGFLHAFQSGDFLVAFVVTRKCLQVLHPLTLKLQQKAKDVVAAYGEISAVKTTVKGFRDDVIATFSSWFQEASRMAATADSDLRRPRGAERQTCRSNPPAETTEDYFRRSIGIPFLDHLIAQLDSRFTTGSEIAVDGLGLVPSCIVQGRNGPVAGFRKVPEGIERLASLWQADLPSFHELDTEYIRWMHKWESADAGAVPDTVAKTLRACNVDFFPNIHVLLTLLCTLPITTAECERTISGIRTLKSYLRSTMGETRLNGLALMRAHRHITVDIDDVVERFAGRYRTIMALQPRNMLNA